MSTLKIQRVRFCVQCHDPLGLKCRSCAKHPDREPKVVEYFDWPKILKVCECTTHVMIECQREGCGQKTWKQRHGSGGHAVNKTLYCSRKCNLWVQAQKMSRKTEVACDYCGAKLLRSPSSIKLYRTAYCHKECVRLSMIKKNHEAREAKKAAAKLERDGTDGRALLQCEGKCRGEITEHREIRRGTAECGTCGQARKTTAMLVGV